MTLQSQRDARKQDIADYQKRLEEIHKEKLNTYDYINLDLYIVLDILSKVHKFLEE